MRSSFFVFILAVWSYGQVQLENMAFVSGTVAMTHAGDERLFITTQGGRIFILDGTQVLATPFLDIDSLVLSGGERGLLSTAFHPNYAVNGLFYVNYTNLNGDTVIARYRVSTDPNIADSGTAAILLTIGQPFSNHNGGQLQFGPDGFLYIGMGDGGSAGDPGCHAQQPDDLLGKMLRLDVDRNVNTPPFHGIPADNPFTGDPTFRDEIWALGVRNPWRFSFDRLNGDLYIADVGQNLWEEINFKPAAAAGGQNYGWDVMEAMHCFENDPSCPANTPLCDSPLLTDPVVEYNHNSGRCSITGGYVYRGCLTPELYGKYIYADFCSQQIWSAEQVSPGNWLVELLPVTAGPTTFGEDVNGELYVESGGAIFRFRGAQTVADFYPFWNTNPDNACFEELVTVLELVDSI